MDDLKDLKDDRLESWKEIAAYLKRDVTTAQRWEKRENMPVHRHLHGRLGSVYAYPAELDAWRQSRKILEDPGAVPGQRLPTGQGESPTGGVQPRAARLRVGVWIAIASAVAVLSASLWFLWRADYFYRNPLEHAEFRPITDFEGNEFAAAISRDGKFVAFLSDRDGPLDVWVTQVGSGQFHNLTHGAVRELANPSVRTLGFSPDGTLVTFWVRRAGPSNPGDIGIWAVPALGGVPRPYLDGIAEFDWSHRGAELVYHTPGPGDPTFVRNGTDRLDHQIFAAPAGRHAHFPVWSPDDGFVYFVQGSVLDEMDIWRISARAGSAERLTFHRSQVSYPAFLNGRTLLYLASTRDGAGPWLYGLDLERHITHRLTIGPEQYSSLSVSADGRKVVVTVANPKGTLWRVPISPEPADLSAARQIPVPTAHGTSPRLGPGYLLYVTSRNGGEAIWKLGGGNASELWSDPGAHIIGAPAIAPDGRRIAFTAEQREQSRLYVMNADGSNLHALPALRQPLGMPEWAPDGRSIAVADGVESSVRLVRVGVADGSVAPLASGYSIDPAWSRDGRMLLYSGADVGTIFPVKAVGADGTPVPALNMELSRGGRRLRFMPDGRSLVFLRGDIEHKNLWLRDLTTGTERPLTNFNDDFSIRDFDVSADGREIVFDRIQANSDVVLIELPAR